MNTDTPVRALVPCLCRLDHMNSYRPGFMCLFVQVFVHVFANV